MDEKEKIVVEELEDTAEPKKEVKAELTVQSFEPSEIGGVFFTESGLTVFPKGYMEQFAVDKPNGGLIGKSSTYDYSKLAGAFERVVTLEKENTDLKTKVAELESKMAEDEKDKEDEKPPEVEKPDEEKDKDEEQEKDEADKKDEKDSAVAKSVEAEKSTKEEAEHSGVDDDIKRLTIGMQKAREEGSL